jgi:netrin receptor unc-5
VYLIVNLQAYFTCNGEAMAAADRHKEEDRMEMIDKAMVSVKQLTIEINRNQVEEFFGHFSCRCDAWSSRGMSSSKNATVEMACKSNKKDHSLMTSHNLGALS